MLSFNYENTCSKEPKRGVVMSNHSVGHAFNSALKSMVECGAFERLGKDTSTKLAVKFAEICRSWDGKSYEALEDLEEYFGVCSCCLKKTQDLVNGCCSECRC
ncbi:MAG: hypothetical protein Q4F66_05505 [Clostridium sp.]|nr:hypothetical protein [Clostridium sp.]